MRIWSTDWWFNADEAIERLHDALNDALEQIRSEAARAADLATPQATEDLATAREVGQDQSGDDDTLVVEPDAVQPGEGLEPAGGPADGPSGIGARLVASSAAASAQSGFMRFTITDLSAFKADPDLFYTASYRRRFRQWWMR